MFGSWLEVVGTLWFVAVVVILVWVLWPSRRRALPGAHNGSSGNKPRSGNQAPFDAGGGNVGSSNVHLGGSGHGDGGSV